MISIAKECLEDLLNRGTAHPLSNMEHIGYATDWLISAQKAGKSDGISAFYSFGGWAKSYPETSGYIIPTLFDLYHHTNNKIYKESALKMADWLLSIQLENGAFPMINLKTPIVFDTGQVLFGLIRTYKETKDDKYLISANKAGQWISKIKDWKKSTYKNVGQRAYHARVAWALLELHEVTQNDNYLFVAKKILDWVLSLQLDNGWLMKSDFGARGTPLTHTIAYTIRGLLESGVYLSNENYINATIKTSDALIDIQRENGSLFGKYDSAWKNTCNWSCLTGDAQISCVWLRLYTLTDDEKYLNAAKKMNDYLKTTQNISSKNDGIKGGIKGSQPIWGEYMSFRYVNWAAKFFIDALLLEEKLSRDGN